MGFEYIYKLVWCSAANLCMFESVIAVLFFKVFYI
jgi:hypothetical protein